MISIERYFPHLNLYDVAKYAGQRENTLLTDPVRIARPKKDQPDTVEIPIRWMNFCWAVLKVMEGEKLRGLPLIQRALAFAKEYCFDFDGAPMNIARLNQYSSYAKMMVDVEDRIKKIE